MIGHLLETFLRHFYLCDRVRACLTICDHVQACPTMFDCVRPFASVFDHAQLPEWPTVLFPKQASLSVKVTVQFERCFRLSPAHMRGNS